MAPNNTFSIFVGDEKTIYLKAVNAEKTIYLNAINAECAGNGDPLDLTACTQIDIALPKADGTFTHLLYTTGAVIIPAPKILGKFHALIQSAASALLNPGELQNIDVTFTIAGRVFTVRFYQALSVFERG